MNPYMNVRNSPEKRREKWYRKCLYRREK